MTTLMTQSTDVFTDTDPGIRFDRIDESWTISAGVLVSSGRSVGVGSNFDQSTLFNNGTILSGAESRGAVELSGNDSSIANSVGARIIAADTAIFLIADGATVDNHGSIQGLAGDGIELDTGSARVLITNHGTIDGREAGIRAFSGHDGGLIHNFGAITSAGDAIDIDNTDSGLTTVITNAAGAIIRGSDAAILVETFGRVSLDNRGTVSGAIFLSWRAAENDVVTNHGRILGPVLLGDGNDVFNGAGGTAGEVDGEKGNDRLIGGGKADNLFGGAGGDRLIGAGANDFLEGGSGFDTLTGGPGSDRFVFDSGLGAGSNVDRITDFAAGIDKIVLADAIFPHLGPVGVLGAAHFHVGALAADASDRIIYNPATGFLFYDSDGRGGTPEVHFATLAAHLALHNSDFTVIHFLIM